MKVKLYLKRGNKNKIDWGIKNEIKFILHYQ